MSKENIKWGCIQPLTGGMYIGARNAIGHPAAWVISYPGLTDVKLTKTGEIGAVGNEYNILDWCKKRNELPPYKVFNKKPFDDIDIHSVELLDVEGWSTGDVDLSNTDIVVSVPVCSGLSQATIASEETKMARNCNMVWNAKFALGVVKPKVYIFENAPTLYAGKAAEPVRELINGIGEEFGYSVIYYKTDTKFHDNCQRRPRTFVIFVKHNENGTGAPELEFEHIRVSIDEYMNRIPVDATQQITVDMNKENIMIYDYIKQKYGPDYRTTAEAWTIGNIIHNDLWNDFYNFIDNYDTDETIKNRMKHICEHIQYKLSMDKNFYVLVPGWTKETDETVPGCMFKTIPTCLHYKEDRLFTIREWLHIMGHPTDFELHGNINANYAKIGQNVPVRTAQWITSEAVRLVTNWDDIDRSNENIRYFDNTKMKKG